MSEFVNCRAVVTGGGSGIGLATANLLASLGAVVAVLDLDPSAAPEPMHKLRCDIADTASVERAMSEAAQSLGGIDILINNAGRGAVGSIEDNPDDEWLDVLNTNVMGVVRITRSALPHLRQSKTAAIVNVGSVTAGLGVPRRAALTASKGAIQALTRAMAADYLPEGIRVNSVNPGTVDTAAVVHIVNTSVDPAATRAALERRQPIGRLLSAEEVARAICYLASPKSGAITGEILTIDGGVSGIRLS